jgi:hypothetical protein
MSFAYFSLKYSFNSGGLIIFSLEKVRTIKIVMKIIDREKKFSISDKSILN